MTQAERALLIGLAKLLHDQFEREGDVRQFDVAGWLVDIEAEEQRAWPMGETQPHVCITEEEGR